MKIGTIGTSVITDRMIEAVKHTEHMDIEAIFSRGEEKAKSFAMKHDIPKYYSDLDAMLGDPQIDTIYVASPNSLHFSQSKKAILAGKHVICEKPFTPTIKECEELFALAKQNGVYIFEAITTIHLPNYQIVREHLKDCGDIRFVQLNFSQFSSRYAKYKAKEQCNAFDPAFHGGALMDINVYCLHFVTGLFGRPQAVTYSANIGYNGIDTSGIVVMRYPDFLAACIGAKDSSSENGVFIQGDEGTLHVFGSSCGVCKSVEFTAPKKDMIGKKDTTCSEMIGVEQGLHMVYECRDFERIVREKDEDAYEKLCEQTRIVVNLLEECTNQYRK